jgi:hypothetical protein
MIFIYKFALKQQQQFSAGTNNNCKGNSNIHQRTHARVMGLIFQIIFIMGREQEKNKMAQEAKAKTITEAQFNLLMDCSKKCSVKIR